MANTVIKVENISKQYRLGNVGLGTISHDFNRWYQTTIRRREDPYLKIGEANDRSIKGESEYVWALRDINFEVKQGEVLGIIGRNGAGKSTLLKILSRTTTPTTGQIKIKGRVASLLEVGTGFHPELTGRENIFLNGAILGMTKQEIKSKFDEIVDFSGVERYIDTPVKRYSSGMYVRLAFGVAAHLEPEILIVDEVLAVGDAEFQKKALGKMKDVSGIGGRTVLFVSHNLPAVRQLCTSAMLLDNGMVTVEGATGDIIKNYLRNDYGEGERPVLDAYRNYSVVESPIMIEKIFISGFENIIPTISIDENPAIIIRVRARKKIENAVIAITLYNAEDVNLGIAFSLDDNFYLNIPEPGSYDVHFRMDSFKFAPHEYYISVGLNQSENTNSWDGISLYPLFNISKEMNVEFYKNRQWGVIHFSGNSWEVSKTV
ncbi:MAG TPA: polysaccharide ABC transporter ATP-binding protein [Hanamia sp.]